MEHPHITGEEEYYNLQAQRLVVLQDLYFTDRRGQARPAARASRELAAILGSCARSHAAHGRTITAAKPTRAEKPAWIRYIISSTK